MMRQIGAAIFLAICNSAQVASAQITAAVSVDFSSPVLNNRNMAGFLHAADSVNPPDSAIQGLQPRLWRVGNWALLWFDNGLAWPQIYNRFTQFGAQVELIVSDVWSYNGPWPYENWANWEAFVRQLAMANQGRNLFWDVWNEPDNAPFWPGTQAQLFETYLRAYKILRQVLGPSAMIGGPSIAGGGGSSVGFSQGWTGTKAYLTAFLNYCLANGCQVNFLSWHALDDNDIQNLASHITDARSSFLQNPVYSSLSISQIHLNEVVGPLSNHDPGGILGYLSALEQGNADAAAKSCWSDGSENECYDDTLNGLLTPGTFQPRAGWWAYQSYALGVHSRVASASSNPRVVSLASSNTAGGRGAQVLVGYYNYSSSAPAAAVTMSLNHINTLPFLSGATQAQVELEQIPASNDSVLTEPILVSRTSMPIVSGSVSLLLPTIAPGEAWRITLSNPAPATAIFRDTAGSVRLSTYASSTLSNSGGFFGSDPSAAQDLTGNAFVTARDTFNAVWANVYSATSHTWAGWQFGGGAIQGVPSIAVDTSGTGWIASRDGYNSYWLISFTPATGYGTWIHLAGVFVTDPAVTACGDGSLYLVGKDNYNALWSGHYIPGSGFQGFQLGGGVVKGKPSVSCGSDNAAYISARDNFNSNWVARVSGSTWTGWFNGGAVANIDPRIAALGGRLAAVILDGAGAVYRATFTEGTGNGWGAWTSVGAVLSDITPASVSGELLFAGRAPNNDLWWWRQSGNQWTWIGNNGVAAGALAVAPR